jgi:hypothetical protein
MTGLTQSARLAALADRLSERDQAIVADVVRLRFLSAGQLARLHFWPIPQPVTRARRVQRTVRRLAEQGLLDRCQRRVGGVRAGSSGFTYAPSAEAIRLTGYLAGRGMARTRGPVEPGTTFLDHTVAVNELYVRLVEAQRHGDCELLTHEAEPDSWRRFLGPIGQAIDLRPDAFVALGVGELELRSFIEVDRGREGTTALRRKLTRYVDYWRSGAEQQAYGVFPRVLWQADTARRAEVLCGLVAELSAAAPGLFVVAEPAGTLDCLLGRDIEPEAAR